MDLNARILNFRPVEALSFGASNFNICVDPLTQNIGAQPPSQATTSPIDDPLTQMTGPMTSSRTKKMKDALATLILEVQADSFISSQSLGLGKSTTILSVTSGLPRH